MSDRENDKEKITNTLYSGSGKNEFHWPRLPHQYHGSGCTLASAISAYMVKAFSIEDAIKNAQIFTDKALQHAIKLGHAQYHPNRFIEK